MLPPDARPAQPVRPVRLQVDAASAGMRADHFLARELPSISRTRIRQKVQMGESRLNGRRYATSTRLAEGDMISIAWREGSGAEASPAARAAQGELQILWEDGSLVVVNKPAGIASHPMGRVQADTVVQRLRDRYADAIHESLSRGDPGFYPRLVNRLDTFTSGIVVVALTRPCQLLMQDLVVRRLVHKKYIALVEGTVAAEEGRIELPLGRDETSGIRVKMAPRPDGLASVTCYRVVRRMPAHTLLEIVPLSGRQHQIRVHLAAIGHPVLGDLLYRDESLFLRYQALGGALDGTLPSRHCLHASEVRFTHPASSETVTVTAPLPGDFLSIMARLA
jgi:23S rRNA pseudouridine1911/1915/1917 synthase